MIRLFRYLLFGDIHIHKWACVEKLNKTNSSGNVVAVYYINKCEICGKMKKFST